MICLLKQRAEPVGHAKACKVTGLVRVEKERSCDRHFMRARGKIGMIAKTSKKDQAC